MSDSNPPQPNPPNPGKRDPRLRPILSDLANDNEMAEIIECFVMDLHDRANGLCEALQSGDARELTLLAKQVRMAAGGSGFRIIASCAAELERIALAEEMELSAVAEKTEALIELCKRATA